MGTNKTKYIFAGIIITIVIVAIVVSKSFYIQFIIGANKGLPMTLNGGIGTIDKIDIKDNCLTYYATFKDEYVDIPSFERHQKEWTKVFCSALLITPENFTLLEKVINKGYGYMMIIQNMSGEKTSVGVNNQELKDFYKTYSILSPTEQYIEALKLKIKIFGDELPIVVDEGLILKSVQNEDNTIVFSFAVDETIWDTGYIENSEYRTNLLTVLASDPYGINFLTLSKISKSNVAIDFLCMPSNEKKRILYSRYEISPIISLPPCFNNIVPSTKEIFDTVKYSQIAINKVETGVNTTTATNITSFVAPNTWGKYTIDGAFTINVPPTVELRHDYDVYTKQLKEMGLLINSDVVIFQQKNLSKGANNNHYARIMIQHYKGQKMDFLKYHQTELLDRDSREMFQEMINDELGYYGQIGESSFNWITINNNAKAIEITYRRRGTENYTAHVTMYFMQNDDEMVKMIVSYREQEKNIWIPDLDNVIKTFNWNKYK